MTDLAAPAPESPDPGSEVAAAHGTTAAMKAAMAPVDVRRSKPASRPLSDATRGWDVALVVLFGLWTVLAAVTVAHGLRVALLLDRFLDNPTAGLTQSIIDLEGLDTALLWVRVGASLVTAVVIAVWSIRVRDELRLAKRTIASPADP